MARRRARPDAERIAGRMAGVAVAQERDAESGVLPLNPGFFAVEQMRAARLGKTRADQRARVKSK